MFNIAVLPGDGIGPEIIDEALKVLKVVGRRFGHEFNFTFALVGGAAYDEVGHPLPQETLELCFNSDAVLFGAVGGEKWDNLPTHLRPEVGALLPLRKQLGLFANLRPAEVFPALANASTLKADVVQGLDLMVVRELTGGLYFGERKKEEIPGGHRVVDTLVYTTEEISRVARLAFELAGKRNKKVTLVDKANVLETSRYWRDVVTAISKEYPGIVLDYMYVDNAAMQLVRYPKQFDVLLTENMFGDILSDLAAQLTGSLGMLASASLGGKVGLYEPIHGSAPLLAGLKKANPIATIMSGAMLLRYSFNLEKEAQAIKAAITEVLKKYRTEDIMEEGKQLVNTEQMGDYIAEQITVG